MGIQTLQPEVVWALTCIFAVLIVASLLVLILKWVKPQADFKELTARTRTWWVLVIAFGFALVMSRPISLAFFAFVSFLALKEYLSLIPTRRADRRVLFWAYLAVPLQFTWIYLEWYGLFLVFIPVYIFLLIPARIISIGQTDGFIRAVGTLHWGIMTTIFSLSHAAYLLVLSPVENSVVTPSWPNDITPQTPGPGLLVMLVALTQTNDVAQYVWGKSFGNRRVAPKVSPGKTWAGLLGGIATTTLLAATLGPMLTVLDWQHGIVVGLIIGVGGFLGDLSLSAVKRDLGVKDTGSMLPGHGGILDRVDSLTYTAPLFFHFIYYCYF